MAATIGTTKVTLDPKIPPATFDVELPAEMWNRLGGCYVGLVEVQVVERTEPSDFDVDRKVKLRVVTMELAHTDATADELREQMRGMYGNRTGRDALQFDEGTGEVR